MPFVGKWSARIRQPGQFIRIRTELEAFGSDIDVAWGIKRVAGKEETFVQAIRFDSSKFSRADVTKWLREHDDTQTGKPYKAIDIEAPKEEASFDPGMDSMLALYASGNWTPVTGQETHDGVVHQKFRKELMKVGQYKPVDREPFTITLDTLNHWTVVSKQMHANGVRIPVTAGPIPHKDISNPKNGIGTMEDEFVEGDSLYVILDIVGEENIEDAVANDVSVFSPLEWMDGKGRKYDRPITHVAITPNPLVPGLEGWEQIAASHEASNEGKEKGMWKKMGKALGMSAEDIEKLTDANGLDKILAGIKAMLKTHKDEIKAAKKGVTKASIDADEDLKEAFDTEVKTEVDKQVEARTTEIKAALTGAQAKDPDPVVVGLLETNRKLRLNTAVEACLLTSKAREDIEARYGKADVIAASLKAGDSGEEFKFWMEILSKNDPVELTEKTGAQVIKAALKDPNKGGELSDEDNPLLKDAARRAEAAKK